MLNSINYLLLFSKKSNKEDPRSTKKIKKFSYRFLAKGWVHRETQYIDRTSVHVAVSPFNPNPTGWRSIWPDDTFEYLQE